MDVSVVLTAHREGILAKPTCDSLALAKAEAEKAGIELEVVVVLDRADDETTEFAESQTPIDWRKIHVDYGDPGRARNAGVRVSKGQWIAFLDADDLFGRTWLQAAHAAATQEARLAVWHPEVSIYFGEEKRVFVHVDMDDAQIDGIRLICSNYWSALCFAPKALLQEIPYPETLFGHQIGHEDWSWNLLVMAKGAIHKVVPGAGHLIRVKRTGSVMRRAAAAGCIPKPSDFYRQLLRNREAEPQSTPRALVSV